MLKIFQALKNIITSTKEISTTLLLNMWCVGYEGGDDAAQVSIVKDVSLLSACLLATGPALAALSTSIGGGERE